MKSNLADISKELNCLSQFEHMASLIFITDQASQARPEHVIEKLTKGSMVIFRDYDQQNRAELGTALSYICRAKEIKFLVAADLTLCLMLKAHGIHLPEHMIGEAQNIRQHHPELFITASAHNEQAVKKAVDFGVDAILLSPIFPTKSHPETFDDPSLTIGTDRLKNICEKYNIALYALGGVTTETAIKLRGTGVAGIAGIRGLEA
jgi:thiamine-phosphate pyrophosphorylase